MSDSPSFFEDLRDRAAVAVLGGVRVRVLESGEGVVLGRTPGPPPDRIKRIVLDVAPGPGVVHLFHEGNRWILRTSGELAGGGFEQRLRNVLGNL